MRIIPFLVSASLTAVLIIVLNSTLVLPAPLGKLLSPQHGIWQNAEATDKSFNADLKLDGLQGQVKVYLDERLVPHIFAEQENDAWFVQGYLHAKFRLWQMEFQTHAAAGRISEIVATKDPRVLNFDRNMRRLGMVYAAEISQKEVEKDPEMKAACDAYTAGVNSYIDKLTESSLPVEYKIMDYCPERWTNMKTALFLKYMSLDLAGRDEDFELTNAKSFFSPEDFLKLFPAVQDSLDPIIPKGTPFEKQKVFPKMPAKADSVYTNNKDFVTTEETKPDRDNGSNNWAVMGKKTKSGAPILCNDPHLGLNLPSLWYELQISTPTFNAYGVSFPGAPGVIIGFNDSCAFGFTNGGRDVRDYYEINFKDEKRDEYLFNGVWQKTKWRIDTIKIKGKADFIDSVAYVLLGNDWCPVMYDRNFSGGRSSNKKNYAVRWKAHDASNELRIFMLLDKAKNYADYLTAVTNLHTPGQNCAFACKNGDIAIRTQGEWPAKWAGQGDYIMPGTDTNYLWQGMIPQDEVPYQYNPERGFISSGNQKPVDETYPYYIGRSYPIYRGKIINRRLAEMTNITAEDMMALQTDNYNLFAEMARPIMLKNMNEALLSADAKKYFELLKNWNLRNDVGSKGATVFDVLWKCVVDTIYNDEYAKGPAVILHPYESNVVEGLLKDSVYKFSDNINTPQKESLADNVSAAMNKAAAILQTTEKDGKLEWEKYKGTHIDHLTRAAMPSFGRKNLPIGGGNHIINATKETHGPSWRMVIELTKETNAWGVYPGGQNGNPGSKYYDTFIDQWVAGKYYQLWMMKKGEEKDKRIIATISFAKK